MSETSQNGELDDSRVEGYKRLPSRGELKENYGLSVETVAKIKAHRAEIRNILCKESSKFLLVVGPCSVDDVGEALRYSDYLVDLEKIFGSRIKFCMRCCLEKPRTGPEWLGMLYDPDLSGKHDVIKGLNVSLRLTNALAGKVALATEFVDPRLAALTAHNFSYAWTGARNCQSGPNRGLASAGSMSTGFKNTVDGDVTVAVNAVLTARKPQSFLGSDPEGFEAEVLTKGNPYTGVILRGGKSGPNYDRKTVDSIASALPGVAVGVDCSHGNTNKDYRLQGTVLLDVAKQFVESGLVRIALLESYNVEGKQDFPKSGYVHLRKLGQSITDSCIGPEETADLCHRVFEMLAPVEYGQAPWQVQ